MISVGTDFGRRMDRTCTIRVQGDPLHPVVTGCELAEDRHSWSPHLRSATMMGSGADIHLADATGVGDALYEQIPKALGVFYVAKQNRPWNLQGNRILVTKRVLYLPLISIINGRNLAVGCEAPYLEDELRNFVANTSRTGHVTYEAASGHHDDTVAALAMALFGLYLKEINLGKAEDITADGSASSNSVERGKWERDACNDPASDGYRVPGRLARVRGQARRFRSSF